MFDLYGRIACYLFYFDCSESAEDEEDEGRVGGDFAVEGIGRGERAPMCRPAMQLVLQLAVVTQHQAGVPVWVAKWGGGRGERRCADGVAVCVYNGFCGWKGCMDRICLVFVEGRLKFVYLMSTRSARGVRSHVDPALALPAYHKKGSRRRGVLDKWTDPQSAFI
jgi:hypothetical protein